MPGITANEVKELITIKTSKYIRRFVYMLVCLLITREWVG